LPAVLKGLKEREIELVLKKSKMGGLINSVVEQTKVKLLPCSTNATFEKQISLGDAKLTLEIALYKSTVKKQMEDATVKKPGLTDIIPAY